MFSGCGSAPCTTAVAFKCDRNPAPGGPCGPLTGQPPPPLNPFHFKHIALAGFFPFIPILDVMEQNSESPLPPQPTAADYRALLGRFNDAARAHNSGQIDFPAFRQCIAQIEDETRMLNFLRKLHSTCRGISRQERKKTPKPSLSS